MEKVEVDSDSQGDVCLDYIEEDIDILIKQETKPILEYKEKYSNQISVKTRRTRYEILLMIFGFMNKYSLSDLATEDMLRLINVIFGENILPTSKHIFKKIFHNTEYSTTKHLFCHSCTSYIKKIVDDEIKTSDYVCQTCSAIQRESPDNTFITMSVEDQIKKIISNNSKRIFNNQHYRENESTISDITEGRTYQELMRKGSTN